MPWSCHGSENATIISIQRVSDRRRRRRRRERAEKKIITESLPHCATSRHHSGAAAHTCRDGARNARSVSISFPFSNWISEWWMNSAENRLRQHIILTDSRWMCGVCVVCASASLIHDSPLIVFLGRALSPERAVCSHTKCPVGERWTRKCLGHLTLAELFFSLSLQPKSPDCVGFPFGIAASSP